MILTIRRSRCCDTDVAWTNVWGDCQGCLLRTCSPAQRRVFRAIQRLGPTGLREVAEEAGLSASSTVSYHLPHLQKKGLVTWLKGQDRTLMASSSVPPC